MTQVVKINALSVPPQAGEELMQRFAARMDELVGTDGFEGFELLKPTGDNEPRWFVYSRWRDEEAYQAWRNGETFARNHAPAEGDEAEAPRRPVSTGSELLEFEVTVARTSA